MKLTRISEINREYFEELVPDFILNDNELILIGMLSDEGMACSAMAVRIIEESAYIEWLFTLPEFREQGAASQMLDVLLRLLEDTNLSCIETDYTEDEDELDGFLEDAGFLTGDERDMYRVPLIDLAYSPLMDELSERDKEVKGVFSVSNMNGELGAFIREHGMDPECLEDISDIYSFCKTGDDGRISGCILISEMGSYDLRVLFLASDGSLETLQALIISVYKTGMKTGRTEGNLYFTDHLDKAIELVEALTGEERTAYRIGGRRHAVMLLE